MLLQHDSNYINVDRSLTQMYKLLKSTLKIYPFEFEIHEQRLNFTYNFSLLATRYSLLATRYSLLATIYFPGSHSYGVEYPRHLNPCLDRIGWLSGLASTCKNRNPLSRASRARTASKAE